ncbi:MAG TPA: GTP-binding protein [Methylocella sp.]|nr:GTP-binding protein [Methylocella sp.]
MSPQAHSLQRRPPPPFPLTVLTGFLGAGKTTLLNCLLRDPAAANSFVIINEFGDVGLDHILAEPIDGDVLLLASGCLCCSLRGDLVTALEDILRRRDNGRVAPFERVIIETTGLADPLPILQTLVAHPYLHLRFKFGQVIGVIDALHGNATLDRHEEAAKQAAVADLIMFSKMDLSGAQGEIAVLRGRLAELNPNAPILDASRGEATAARLLGVDVSAPDRGRHLIRHNFCEKSPQDQERRHHHNHGIRSLCLRHAQPMPATSLELFLKALLEGYGGNLLRLKGLIALDSDPLAPIAIHGVGRMLYPAEQLAAWPDADRTARIVLIFENLDPALIEGLWRAVIVQTRTDGFDASAVGENPLALRRGGLLA